MAKRHQLEQGVLFGDSPAARLADVVGPAPAEASLVRLAERMPGTLYMGTSSWAFPGWGKLVWDRAVTQEKLASSGLAAYATHPLFRTVGLDRTFYAPMSEPAYRELAAMTPPHFRFLVKAHQVCTRPGMDERGSTFGATGGHEKPNPEFLNPGYAIDRVIGPTVLGLGDRCGPIVFQLPPLDLRPQGLAGGAERLMDRIEAFVAALPKGKLGPKGVEPLYAIEVRNRELLTPRFVRALRGQRVITALAGHPTQPRIAEQAALLSPLDGHAVVVRWLLHPSEKYESAKSRYEPFDQLVDVDPTARQDIATLVAQALAKGLPTWIVANNKAEGSAPRSIAKLAEEIARMLGSPVQ